jgi:hypothetical protein
MSDQFSTQSELQKLYEKQRREAVQSFDVPLLKFYAEVDKMNQRLAERGRPPIIPIITD